MVISSYQVNNVLRVYGDQLRQGRAARKIGDTSPSSSEDRLEISAGAKRKALIDRIASKIVDSILQDGPHDEVEKELFKKLQDEYGAPLAVSPEETKGFVFRVIDEKGDALHSLSIEDSNFLTQKLKEITKETVDKNMI
jgi:hypothetical protein